MADFLSYLKSEFLDAAYLQQNAFSSVDAASTSERQRDMFGLVERAMLREYDFGDKSGARAFFQGLSQEFIDWNMIEADAPEYATKRGEIEQLIKEAPGA